MRDGSKRACGEPHHVRDQAAALIAEARGDEARMEAIRGNAGPVQAARELARECITFGGRAVA